MMKLLTLSCCVLLTFPIQAQAQKEPATSAQQTKTLKKGIIGQINVTGEIPKLPLLVNAGIKFIPDESLLVSEEGGLANAFVYLKRLPEGLAVPKMKSESSLIFKDWRYSPHAQITFVRQPFLLINEDQVAVSFHFSPLSGVGNSFILPPRTIRNKRQVAPYEFQKPEIVPVPVSADCHAWVKAYILPLNHPFADVTDKNGNFTIHGLPPGTYEFKVWHERVGWLEKSLSVEVVEDKPTRIQLTYPVERF